MKPVLLVVFELQCWEAVDALYYICMQSYGDLTYMRLIISL